LKKKIKAIKELLKKAIKRIFAVMPTPDFVKRLILQSDKKRRTNILSPLNWLVVTVVPSAFWYMAVTGDLFGKIFAGAIIFLLLGYYVFNFSWFKKHDRDRLQTEEYLIAKQGIELMARQGEEPRQVENLSPVEGRKLIGHGKKVSQ
jgi:hypothetical protein